MLIVRVNHEPLLNTFFAHSEEDLKQTDSWETAPGISGGRKIRWLNFPTGVNKTLTTSDLTIWMKHQHRRTDINKDMSHPVSRVSRAFAKLQRHQTTKKHQQQPSCQFIGVLEEVNVDFLVTQFVVLARTDRDH